MFFDVDESEVRETVDEQITTFINEAYYTYPKEYRQSEEYRGLSIDQKFQDAIKRLGLDRFKELITNKIIDYYL